MEFLDYAHERKREAWFAVDAVRQFPGICIENQGKHYVAEWRDFTVSADTMFDVVYKLVCKVAEYPLDNGGMVRVSRDVLHAHGYTSPPVKRNAVYLRGLKCMTL